MRKEEEEGVRRSNEEKEQRKSLALDNIGIYMYIYQSRRREEGGGPKVPGFQGLEVVYCHLKVTFEFGLDSKEGPSFLLTISNVFRSIKRLWKFFLTSVLSNIT